MVISFLKVSFILSLYSEHVVKENSQASDGIKKAKSCGKTLYKLHIMMIVVKENWAF